MSGWILEELVAQVAMALSAGDYGGAVNGRVRDIPDARAVRYYTTLGILDRPSEMRGRTAYYGVRHLRQIVAIKKLQARGWPLARVQQQLAGIEDGELARIAALSAEVSEAKKEGQPVPAAPRSRRAGAFWTQPPHEVEKDSGIFVADAVSESASEEKTKPTPSTKVPPLSMQGVKLGDHAMLTFQAARVLESGDLEAIAALAAPLLALLEKRGLLPGKDE